MSLASRLIVCIAVAAAAAITVAATQGARDERSPGNELRVCADPNNLPFSNQRGEGFENALADLVAKDLGRAVRYTWWPQRRGFFRNTLAAGKCDVVMGVPAAFDMARPTRPYYRSTYVFVTRSDRDVAPASFDDPRLRRLSIGVHVAGADNNAPPLQALAQRGLTRNVRGFSIYGDYSKPNPPAALIDAVARGEIDVAIAWGPLAGYFAQRNDVALDVWPVSSPLSAPSPPMTFEISMGVRADDDELASALDEILVRRARDIERVLERYGVPLVTKDVALDRG